MLIKGLALPSNSRSCRDDIKLVKCGKISSILKPLRVSLHRTLEAEPEKGFTKAINWRIGRKKKYILALGIIAVILISCFTFLSLKSNPKANVILPQNNNSTTTPSPTAHPKPKSSPLPNIIRIISGINGAVQADTQPKPPGLIESSQGMNTTVWTEVAENAWAFFKPGVGVDQVTGLPYAGGTGFKAFTDWDLGAYIQAVIDAQEIGVIPTNGTWGSDNRLNMVLSFLENRPLNNTTGWPFWFYDATNGKGYLENSTYASDGVDVVDTGKLLVALSNLINYNSSLTTRIDSLVWNVNQNRSNYASLLPIIKNNSGSNSLYAYYCWTGFESFWPQQDNIPNQIMTNISNSSTISTYNITLPDTPITCEPLLMSIFELNNSHPELTSLIKEVYQASEAYYEATGSYAAFSEGSSPGNGYVYEWVVAPNGSTWQITNSSMYYYNGMNPVIFYKVAFGFLALYNTTFARSMVTSLEQALPTPTNGYFDGMDTGKSLDAGSPGSDTNSLILDAALYYIQNNPDS